MKNTKLFKLLCFKVYLFLICFITCNTLLNTIPLSAIAQESNLPDVSMFRYRIDFQNPYDTIEQIIIPSAEANIPKHGSIKIEYGKGIEEALKKFKNTKELNYSGMGYRVQIYSGPNAGAQQAQINFLQQYQDVDVYLVYEQPLFKVRVGNFYSEQDAKLFCKEIKNYYPNALVVPEQIQIKKK